MLSRTSLAVQAEQQENYNMPSSSGGKNKGGKGRERERGRACIWGIKMHEMYLLIKICSNIKTSSCFHFMAVCQDDLT